MAFLALVGVTTLPVAAAVPVKRSQPVIEVRTADKDSGVVEEGTIIKQRFIVANRGQADLELKAVKPSCGCSAARWDQWIRPGQEGTIETEFNTAYFRGPVTKHFMVFCNDPRRPQLDLTLSARVTPLVQISPGPVALIAMDDASASYEFTLERTDGQPMQILQVFPNAPYLKIDVTPLPGNGRYRVAVTTTADTPLGRSSACISLRTDLEKAGSLSLLLMVDRGIVAAPPELFLGVLPGQLTAATRGVVTLSRRSGSFHVTGVTADDPKLKARLETIRAGAEYRITVTYATGRDAMQHRRTLTVTTDDPKQPLLRIPVEGIVQN